MSEEEINEIVEEHYGFTIDEIDDNIGRLSLRVNQLEYNNKKLQQKLTKYKKKIEEYENPNDLTLFYMWLDEKAKDKIKELTKYKERCEKALEQLEIVIKHYEELINEKYTQETSVFINETCKKGYILNVISYLDLIKLEILQDKEKEDD